MRLILFSGHSFKVLDLLDIYRKKRYVFLPLAQSIKFKKFIHRKS